MQATLGVNDLVEAMHHTILAHKGPLADAAVPANPHHAGVYHLLHHASGAVYGAVRATTRLVGGGLDAALHKLQRDRPPAVRPRARAVLWPSSAACSATT